MAMRSFLGKAVIISGDIAPGVIGRGGAKALVGRNVKGRRKTILHRISKSQM